MKRNDVICFVAVLAFSTALPLVVANVFAQEERPAFTAERSLLKQALNATERQEPALTYLEGVLTQEELDAFQAVLLAPRDDTEKRAALERAKYELQRAGLASESKAITEVDAELARVPSLVEAPAIERER